MSIDRFMDDPVQYLLARGPRIPVHLARFYPDRYSDACFARYGVPFPQDSIGNSVSKRRAEFLAGRVCVAHALHEIGIDDFQVRAGRHRSPIWPAHVVGSITHSRRQAAAVVLKQTVCRGVGIDIEEVPSQATLEALVKMAVSEAEHEYIRAQARGSSDFAKLLTLVFSAKESFFKAAHATVGRYFGFDAIELVSVCYDQQRLEFRLRESSIAAEMRRNAANIYFDQLDSDTAITLCLL